MKKILMKNILMKKIKYRTNYSRTHLVLIFFMSQMIHPYILQKKLITFKVTHVILVISSHFKGFKLNIHI